MELELGAPVERGVDLVGKSASTQLEVQGGFPINRRGGGMVLVRLGLVGGLVGCWDGFGPARACRLLGWFWLGLGYRLTKGEM